MKDNAKRIVVKIGGSILTDKNETHFPNTIEEIINKSDIYAKKENIKKISKAIANASTANNLELFILNGAGSFGHPLVDRYRAVDKSVTPLLIHNSVKYLNSLVADNLRKSGINCKSIHPRNNCSYDGHYDISRLLDKTVECFNNNITPSSYGDVIPTVGCEGEYTAEWQVISADDLAVLAAERWSADIIMVPDVPGVYTKKPDIAPVIEVDHVLKKEEFDQFLESKGIIIYQGNSIDKTGGMKEKIFKLCNATVKKINSQVCGIDNLEKALAGEHVGTLIRYRNA